MLPPALRAFFFFMRMCSQGGRAPSSDAVPLFIRLFPSCAQRQDALHFIVDNHKALVNAHAGLCENLVGLGRHGALHADLRRTVGLVAGAALIGANALSLQ